MQIPPPPDPLQGPPDGPPDLPLDMTPEGIPAPEPVGRPLMPSGFGVTPNDEGPGLDVYDAAPSPLRFGKVVAGVIAIALLAHWFWPEFAIQHADGVLVPDEPYQGPPAFQNAWEHEGFTFTPLADFEIKARVLHRRKYAWGRTGELSKWDLALGWGPMSDSWVLNQMEFWQKGRWYYFRFDDNPPAIAPTVALDHSANFHMVASTDEVLDALGDLRVGHVIHLRGHLVQISAEDGWNWQSSMSRTDRGNGSCELVWVEGIEVINDGS